MTDRSLDRTIARLKADRRLLVRRLNDTEERISALHLVKQLIETGQETAHRYAEAIQSRMEAPCSESGRPLSLEDDFDDAQRELMRLRHGRGGPSQPL